MATMNISLPQAMKDYVEAEVATGRYANASDFIRDLIRDRQTALEELWGEIDKGIQSGHGSEYEPGAALARAKRRHADSLGKAAE